MIQFLYKSSNYFFRKISSLWHRIITITKLKGNGVVYSSFRTSGTPFIMVARGGKMIIGRNFAMNNGISHNPIGCPQPCSFFVDRGASVEIGDNVGISQTALVSTCSIKIGNNVKIGGGTCIYTTDFHSLNPEIRRSNEDFKNRVSKPIIIENNVFIGAHSIILKGVTIGEDSIVGAGSVVTKSIPPREIWGGNPAKFIRTI